MHSDAHGSEHGAGEHAPAVPLHRGFREKFLIPLAIPVGCFLAAAVVIFCISQILLAVPGKAATPIALLIAIGILLLCAYLATVPRLTRQTLFSIVGTCFALLVVFGIVGGVYRLENPEKPGSETGAKAASAPGGNLSPSPANEVTTDNKFSVTDYTVEAGKPTTITVVNKGSAVHNMHILNLQDASGSPVATKLLNPGDQADLMFTIDQPGTYNFQCDVHPTEMKGTITVTPPNTAAGAPSTGAGGGNAITETTTDNKFSQTTITVDHGTQVTVTVDNKGAAIHNWNVTGQKDAGGKDVKTDLVPAGKSASVTFQIDQPGSYPFQCDVHPTEMKGTLVVK